MPAAPSTGSTYSFSIYGSDGITQVGATSSGAFYTNPSGATNYSYFNLYNQTANSLAYFDNITVNTIPEPNFSSIVAGLLVLGGLRIRAFRSKAN